MFNDSFSLLIYDDQMQIEEGELSAFVRRLADRLRVPLPDRTLSAA